MEGLDEGGGEGVEVPDGVDQLIKGDLPGFIIQTDPEFTAGRFGNKWYTFAYMHNIILIFLLQTPGELIIPNI